MNAETSLEEEVDELGRRADEDRRDERRQYRATALGRLMHVLGMTPDRPQSRTQ